MLANYTLRYKTFLLPGVRFPCIAFISVTAVDFESLSACVDVLSVQHEAVTLAENVVDVPLIDLWPTMEQREQSVNAATTAEFINLLRYSQSLVDNLKLAFWESSFDV